MNVCCRYKMFIFLLKVCLLGGVVTAPKGLAEPAASQPTASKSSAAGTTVPVPTATVPTNSELTISNDATASDAKDAKELPTLGFEIFDVGTFGSLDNGARIKVAAIDRPLALNKMARLYVKILGLPTENLDVELTDFDARMPQHNHGMVVKPVIRPIPGRPSEFIIEGVKLHMKGEWQMHFTISQAGSKSTVVDDYTL